VPPFATSIYPAIATVSALGRSRCTLLGLLVVGVNEQRWMYQASRTAAPLDN
jgi:hypothetical protein